jgi:hypothetical protein
LIHKINLVLHGAGSSFPDSGSVSWKQPWREEFRAKSVACLSSS